MRTALRGLAELYDQSLFASLKRDPEGAQRIFMLMPPTAQQCLWGPAVVWLGVSCKVPDDNMPGRCRIYSIIAHR